MKDINEELQGNQDFLNEEHRGRYYEGDYDYDEPESEYEDEDFDDEDYDDRCAYCSFILSW